MKVICCYCNKDLGDKAPFEDTRISHGACEACAMKELAIFDNKKADLAAKDYFPINSAA